MKTVNASAPGIIERARTLGFEYEKTITGCCQCTIAAIQDSLGIRNDAVFKAGSGLTAGGGLSCEGSCGGFTGGVMVMSSVFGRCRQKWDNDRKEKDCAHQMAGALLNRTKELDMYLRPLEAIRKTAAGREARFLCGTQVLDPEDAIRAKEAGFCNATWNIETWDRRIFESMCPGKARAVGYDRWRELLLNGVEVFGIGHLSTNFVVGPEIVVPEGFKSQEEGIESNLEGFEWCL